MEELLDIARFYDEENPENPDTDYARFYNTYSTRHSPELGYYYIQFKRSNTPAQRYCGICQRGFLTANAKDRHICGYRNKKLLTGRYKCRTCLYETTLEKRIKKHFIFCKNRSSDEIGLEYEIMAMSNTPYFRLCPLCHKGFKTFTAREFHVLNCLQNKERKKHETPIIFCRKCGRSFLMKTSAKRHFKLCREKELRGGMIRSKKISSKQMGVTQKTIELNLKDLNIITITEIIYENSNHVIKVKLERKDVKCWCIFEFIMVKNEGKSDEEVFPIYFNTSAEQISLESYF